MLKPLPGYIAQRVPLPIRIQRGVGEGDQRAGPVSVGCTLRAALRAARWPSSARGTGVQAGRTESDSVLRQSGVPARGAEHVGRAVASSR